MRRYQLTVPFSSGEKAVKWEALILKLCKRFSLKPAQVVRTAVRTLDHARKEDVILEDLEV